MRAALAQRYETTAQYVAHVACYGRRRGPWGKSERTVCLKDVYDVQGNVVADHAWLTDAYDFDEAGIEPGDLVQFRAHVNVYRKNGGIDYRLCRVSDIRKL